MYPMLVEYTEHRTIHEQEFNAQRLQIVLSVKFLRQKYSMLFRSRERKELIQKSLEVVPLTCNSSIHPISSRTVESA